MSLMDSQPRQQWCLWLCWLKCTSVLSHRGYRQRAGVRACNSPSDRQSPLRPVSVFGVLYLHTPHATSSTSVRAAPNASKRGLSLSAHLHPHALAGSRGIPIRNRVPHGSCGPTIVSACRMARAVGCASLGRHIGRWVKSTHVKLRHPKFLFHGP